MSLPRHKGDRSFGFAQLFVNSSRVTSFQDKTSKRDVLQQALT